ncbi:hypothetical protein AB0G67_46810 [Streptomyces sp. NPDC021056]|uniref:hypothetical protein n=1 Tax=Streptomyces sp. NPDC021056 TaxID=3155012 RepID=UPI0033E9A14B
MTGCSSDSSETASASSSAAPSGAPSGGPGGGMGPGASEVMYADFVGVTTDGKVVETSTPSTPLTSPPTRSSRPPGPSWTA